MDPSSVQAPEQRVVLVDDHARIRKFLGELLTLHGCQVVGEAGDGQAALALLDDVECDVVVMDLHMPGMDGWAATEAICDRHPEVEVVAFSASDDAVIAREVERLGAGAHFSKIDVDGLVEYVAESGGSARRRPR